jgi:type IV pilus assembly protein PilA
VKKRRKRQKGFTLIELIVVIAILGILAAIVVPRLAGFSDRAKASACETEARTVLTALAAMYAEDPDSVGTDTSTDDLKDLAGTLKGSLEISAVNNGAFDFTYTLEGFKTKVTNGQITGTEKLTTGGDGG